MTLFDLFGLFMLFVLIIWPAATYVADCARYVWRWFTCTTRQH